MVMIDIIEPELIPYTFNTLGWYILFALMVIIVLLILMMLWVRWKKNKYRRDAVLFVQNCQSEHVVLEINRLMKLTALRLWNREKLASLQGIKWYEFLNSTMNNAYADTHLFEQMAQANYSSKCDDEITRAFKEFSIIWFKKHKSKCLN